LFKSRSAAQHRQGSKTPRILEVFLVAAAHISPDTSSLIQDVDVGLVIVCSGWRRISR
jgi:hypothetical protein